MSVSASLSGNTVTIRISGNFDISCYEAFMEHVTTAEKFIVDMGDTSYMDSSALGMLLMLREKTGGEQEKIEFRNVNDDVLKILKVAKFDQLFTIS